MKTDTYSSKETFNAKGKTPEEIDAWIKAEKEKNKETEFVPTDKDGNVPDAYICLCLDKGEGITGESATFFGGSHELLRLFALLHKSLDENMTLKLAHLLGEKLYQAVTKKEDKPDE